MIEPWVVDAYNATTGAAVTMSILEPGGLDNDLFKKGNGRVNTFRKDLPRSLNSTGKWSAFAVAHDNSRNQLIKVCCTRMLLLRHDQ